MMQKMDASNKYLSDMININAKDIMDLKNEIKNQTTQIVQLKSITDAMMNQIYELQARMSVLENALENKQ
jgi:capsule polysaccharide export protein KpsE/RkpR